MKSMYLLMIISNQNSMNKRVNSPNKMQRLHQQNRQLGALVFALNSPGPGRGEPAELVFPPGLEVVHPDGGQAAFTLIPSAFTG